MLYYALIYLACINVIAILLTVSDKLRAKRGRQRIPEKTLLTVGLFGGALFEYITMRLIRHKTRHKKFMIGLPLEIILHIIIIILIYLKTAQVI